MTRDAMTSAERRQERERDERRRILRLLLAELESAREADADWYRWVLERRRRRLGSAA